MDDQDNKKIDSNNADKVEGVKTDKKEEGASGGDTVASTKWTSQIAGKRVEDLKLIDVVFGGKTAPLVKRISSGAWTNVEFSKSLTEHNLTRCMKAAYFNHHASLDALLSPLGLANAATEESKKACERLTQILGTFLTSAEFKNAMFPPTPDQQQQQPQPATKRKRNVAESSSPAARLSTPKCKAKAKAMKKKSETNKKTVKGKK